MLAHRRGHSGHIRPIGPVRHFYALIPASGIYNISDWYSSSKRQSGARVTAGRYPVRSWFGVSSHEVLARPLPVFNRRLVRPTHAGRSYCLTENVGSARPQRINKLRCLVMPANYDSYIPKARMNEVMPGEICGAALSWPTSGSLTGIQLLLSLSVTRRKERSRTLIGLPRASCGETEIVSKSTS